MLKQFCLDWKLQKKSFWSFQLLAPGGFLIGFLMVLLIMNLDENPGNWFCMGTVLGGIAMCLIGLAVYSFSYFGEFQLALSMGRGRMAFLGSYALRIALHFVLGYVVLLVLYHVELALYSRIFPQYENDAAFTFLTNWKIILPAIGALVLLTLFIGSLYGRYGKKSMVFFYVLWLFCCFVLPRMFEAEATDTGVLDVVAFRTLSLVLAVPLPVWIGFGAALAVFMIAATIRMARTQMVK